jgi:hypothetical protein
VIRKEPFGRLLRLLVILIAAVEAAFLGLFAVAAMSGDEWGIARAMFFFCWRSRLRRARFPR